MEDKESGDVPKAFQLQHTGLNNRCKDVFSCLDAFEQKHQAFERSRAQEDADEDRRLIHEGPSQEESETVNPTSRPLSFSGRDYHESRKGGRHGHERSDPHQQFRQPMPPPRTVPGRNTSRGRYGRGRAVPDYKLHPERWTEYSLEDVDISDSSMKRAAFDFLYEQRCMREEGLKDESMDLDSSACSKGLFTFKKPAKDSSKTKDVSSKKTSKTSGTFEKMEEDDGDDNDKEMMDDNIDSATNQRITTTVENNSLKRKLEETQDRPDAGDSNRKSGFKSRKIRKGNFRPQRDSDEDDD